MLGWFWRLIVGRLSQCAHQWETAEVRNVVNTNRHGQEIERFQRYILRCQKCGDVCKRDLD